MRWTALALLLLAQEDKEEGFEKLTNGKDLSGWKFQFKEEVPDGARVFTLDGDTVVCSGKPAGYMYTEKSYKDFVLRFDWRYKRPDKLEDEKKFAGNSGYLLFIAEHKVWPRSLEIQGMNRDAGFVIPIGTKAKFELDKEAHKTAVKPVGEWNTMEIVSKDGKVTSAVNGVKIATVTECELKEGPIGFQSEGAEIHWRNLRIKVEKAEK
jgi:hypothetical protein